MELKVNSIVNTLMLMGVICIIAIHCHPQKEAEYERNY